MPQTIRNVKIHSTGSFVPEKIFTNEYLETVVDTSAEWVYQTLGVKERRIASEYEATSDLAHRAALRALESGNLRAEDLDLIIVATTTPDRPAPSTACILQEKLGAFRAAAFDLTAVCSGFIYALSVAAQFISAGTYDSVLVVGADTFSKVTDWNRRDCVFFGDGAGAAILTSTAEGHGFISMKLYADGRGKHAWTIPCGGSESPTSQASLDSGGHFFQMNGRAVFDSATTVLPNAIREVISDAGLTLEQVKYILPHQPSIGILKKTAENLNVDFNKILTNMDRYANTSAATIPILLDETNRKGMLNPGDFVVFAAVGSGWTWGAAVMKWV